MSLPMSAGGDETDDNQRDHEARKLAEEAVERDGHAYYESRQEVAGDKAKDNGDDDARKKTDVYLPLTKSHDDMTIRL